MTRFGSNKDLGTNRIIIYLELSTQDYSDKYGNRITSAVELVLKGYRLTTAEILFDRPDHPELLQSYIWQEYDLSPQFPVLSRFLRFWERKLDGKLHSVRVAAGGPVAPAGVRHVSGQFTLQ